MRSEIVLLVSWISGGCLTWINSLFIKTSRPVFTVRRDTSNFSRKFCLLFHLNRIKASTITRENEICMKWSDSDDLSWICRPVLLTVIIQLSRKRWVSRTDVALNSSNSSNPSIWRKLFSSLASISRPKIEILKIYESLSQFISPRTKCFTVCNKLGSQCSSTIKMLSV